MQTAARPALGASIDAGVAYLIRAQHPRGSWSDFWLPVGTSEAWVTACVALALQDVARTPAVPATARARAGRAASAAAAWLRALPRPLRGWGYNRRVPPDADSTAHALSCLARAGIRPPAEGIAYLHEHRVPGQGYRTYRFADPRHRWTGPAPDVTAAALRALFDAGVLDRAALRAAFEEMLAPVCDGEGVWHGFWWATPAYATGLALEVWALAGRPDRRSLPPLPTESSFDLAWAASAAAATGSAAAAGLAARLAAQQNADGGWPSAPILRVPPQRDDPLSAPIVARDARRLFVTATAIRSLASALEREGAGRAAAHPASEVVRLWWSGPAARAPLGLALDDLVRAAAAAAGVAESRTVLDLFRTLTRESLASPCPWPAPQLSSLSGGVPVEFSVIAGPSPRPALRYAVEAGVPVLPPHARARTGLRAVGAAADILGYGAAWARLRPALRTLVDPGLPVGEGVRFWVWAGIDHEAGRAPVVKLYLSLLHHEAGGARARLEIALRAAGIPVAPGLSAVLDALETAGFLHEVGFGLGPSGSIGCKVYAEMRGWRRSLAQALLERLGLPPDAGALCPAIPGVLTESLAAKARAGIAVRVDAGTGAVGEITSAAAFPAPLLAPRETGDRVGAWIRSHGWSARGYAALCDLLASTWDRSDVPFGRLHSLVTRTVTATASWATVYLRPWISGQEDGRRLPDRAEVRS